MNEDDYKEAMIRAEAVKTVFAFNASVVHSAIVAKKDVSWNLRDMLDASDIVTDYIKYGIKPKRE